jgi:short-subunit dehydrogenase
MFSRRDLRGARTIVTGASSGIGHALALRLAAEGARLVLASRNRERLDALAEAIHARAGSAVALPADVADAAQRAHLIDATVRQLGGLDILVNNAGLGASGFFEEAGEDRLRKIFEVNFFGTTELTRLALPLLKQGRNPAIVNVASVLGRRAIPGCVEYCASKFAVVGWSEGLRAELARYPIDVLIVCPGGVETEFDTNLIEKGSRIVGSGSRRRMPADECARQIVRALKKRRHEVVITAEAKVAVWANRWFPRLVDWGLARLARRAEDCSNGTRRNAEEADPRGSVSDAS